MAKYTRSGSVLNVDFEDNSVDNVSLDIATLNDEVKDALLHFGAQTILRNTTAGKMDDLVKARAAMVARIATFQSGRFVAEAQSKAALELTDEEQKATIAEVIVLARRAKGDTRADADIIAAFNGLDEGKKGAIMGALKKTIDAKLKKKLQEKRRLSKTLGKGDTPEF